jgi:hypothetical protein
MVRNEMILPKQKLHNDTLMKNYLLKTNFEKEYRKLHCMIEIFKGYLERLIKIYFKRGKRKKLDVFPIFIGKTIQKKGASR